MSIKTEGLYPKIPISPAIVEPIEHEVYSSSDNSDNPPYAYPVKTTFK
jgi:hypothetical protein